MSSPHAAAPPVSTDPVDGADSSPRRPLAAELTRVGDLVADTLPWLDAGLIVPLLGGFEMTLGLVLISDG
jgi:hypothetical protein